MADPASEAARKPRSCALCAQRKVRCDKRYPCGRCRDAGIPCLLQPVDHRPRWARSLVAKSGSDATTSASHATPTGVAVESVIDRLKVLEGLVRDLSSELEEAKAASTPSASQSESHSRGAPSSNASGADVRSQPAGRIILQDSDMVRYVSSGFWSRIDDELDSLKRDTRELETDDSDDALEEDQSREILSATGTEADRAPLDRNAFLFGHNLSLTSIETPQLLPLASQIPFLVEVFSERVHFIIGVPHMPSLNKLLRHCRSGNTDSLSPSEEALIFAIFYSAVSSLDDDEVTNSFDVPKNELTSKYRTGLERALAKADFLNNPSIILVQALIVFLALVRRHDSPKFVWMMIGLVVRMAQYLGLHHDGSNSKHLTPFQVEMHRRIWWSLVNLDMRGTEDQGSELAITPGSFTTEMPSNINDADISPDMSHKPDEKEGITDMTFPILCCTIARNIHEMMTPSPEATLADYDRRLRELKRKFERQYFQYADRSRDDYVAAEATLRVVLGRLTLLTFLPVLFSAPTEEVSNEIRSKLLVAAIDIAEYSHGLNSDGSCRPWRWVYQTHQHWHAVVYLLIEICRRSWSPIIERAWLALQSPWLVPARAPVDKNFSVWVPLKKLTTRARKHREDEIARLQSDNTAAVRLEREDRQQSLWPSSATTFPGLFNDDALYERWRQLVRLPEINSDGRLPPNAGFTSAVYDNDGRNRLPAEWNDQSASAWTNTGESTFATNNMDFNDLSNLDDFLNFDAGLDEDMNLSAGMNADDALNLDWGNWFESARDVLSYPARRPDKD